MAVNLSGVPIVVTVIPSPTFSISPPLSDGTSLSISSTSFFPVNTPRENYALYARVTRVGNEQVLAQPSVPDPLVEDTFPLSLEKDGVYIIRLVAFDREDNPSFFNKAIGTVLYDGLTGKLVQLIEVNNVRSFVPIAFSDVPLRLIPYVSAPKYYLQTKPGEDSRNERLAKVLDYHMEGKKALYKDKIRELDKEIRDFDLALRGASNEFKLERYVEAQRILDLLDLLRSDSCLC